MSSTRTAETPRLEQVERWASAPGVAGPRLPQTLLARATADRPDETRETLRATGGIAIAQNISLERIASQADVDIKTLRQSLLDPDFEIPTELLASLSKFVKVEIRKIATQPFAETSITRRVEDVLNHAESEQMLAVMIGDYRIGKSKAAQRWAKMRPHTAVYLEVPSGSEKCIFMRALGQCFGIGVSNAIKSSQIEWKIRQACVELKPILILDEAHRLWTEDNRKTPQRIEFIRDLIAPAVGASVVCISTNQFANSQEQAEKNSRTWGSGQWVGRIGRYEELPGELSAADLTKVIKAHLPGAGEKAVAIVLEFALSSDGLLGSVEHVAKMARYLARKENRDEPSSTNIIDAVRRTIPTSQRLRKAIAKGVAV